MRYEDCDGRTWRLVQHATSTPTAALALPLSIYPPWIAMLEPLLSELWARSARHILRDLCHGLSVRSLSSPDFIGIAVEAQHDSQPLLMRSIERLLDHGIPYFSELATLNDRETAVQRLRKSSAEIEGLRAFALPGHRYYHSVEERSRTIHETNLLKIGGIDKVLKPIVVAVGDTNEFKFETSLLPSANASTDSPATCQAPFPKGRRIVKHNTDRELGRITLLTPAPNFSSRQKYDLHVAAALLRSREGVLFPRLRSMGALAYEVAAYTREYRDGGFAMTSVRGDFTGLDDIREAYFRSIDDLVKGRIDSRMIACAVRQLQVEHFGAMRNPIAVILSNLYEEMSGVQSCSYSLAISTVTAQSLAIAVASYFNENYHLIKLSVPRGSS